jgi:hypothetical protein
MAWTRLILDFLAAIAWPLVVLALLLVIRKPLVERLHGLLEVEGPGVKARFGQVLEQAEEAHEVAAAVDEVTAALTPAAEQDAVPGVAGDIATDGDTPGPAETTETPEKAEPPRLRVPTPRPTWRGPLTVHERAELFGIAPEHMRDLNLRLQTAAGLADGSPKSAATLAWSVVRAVTSFMRSENGVERVSDLIPVLRASSLFGPSDAALLRSAEELVGYPEVAWAASDDGGRRFVRLVEFLIDRLLMALADAAVLERQRTAALGRLIPTPPSQRQYRRRGILEREADRNRSS